MRHFIKFTIFVALLTLCSLACKKKNPPQVIIIGIDALDYEILTSLMKQNRLPNFSTLAQNSVLKKYKSERPLRSPAIWTTIATGQSRNSHGIYDFMTDSPLMPVHLRDTENPRLVTSDDRRIKALWNYTCKAEIKTVVVSWIKTWPAELINGVMVAPYAALNSSKQATLKGGIYKDTKDQITPPAMAKQLYQLILEPEKVSSTMVKHLADFPASDSSLYEIVPRLKLYHYSMKWSLAHTETTTRLTVELMKIQKPRLVMAYFEGADSLAHRFWAFRNSEEVIKQRLQAAEGDPSAAVELKQRFGKVVEGYYEEMDKVLGRILKQAEPNAVVIVLSDHGFEDRTVKLNTHVPYDGQHRLEGVIMISGQDRYQWRQKKELSIYDIAPTALALLGLSIPEDLPGQCLLRGNTLDRGIVHENIETMREQYKNPRTPDYAKEEIQRLRSLGYVK